MMAYKLKIEEKFNRQNKTEGEGTSSGASTSTVHKRPVEKQQT